MKGPMIKNQLFTILLTIFYYCHVSSATVLTTANGNQYTWKSGTWSTCISQGKCGLGQRIRKITCQDSSGFLVDNSNCDESRRPSTVKECFRVCDKHKHVLRWKIGKWSPCIPKIGRSPSVPCTGVSLPGVAERKIGCILTTTETKVDISACEYFWDKPESNMSCSLDCPQNCILTKRNFTCILEGCQKHQGWTREVSELVVLPFGEGSACPETTKEPICRREMLSKVCSITETFTKGFLLKIGEWSSCQSHEKDNVNEFQISRDVHISLRPTIGFSRRNVTCISRDGTPTGLSFCNVGEMPVMTKRCVVPVHCEVSPWSEWRVRKEGCISSDGKVHPETRTRYRRLLQIPVGQGAIPCPPLHEERKVSNDLPSCYKYQWYPLEWSGCELRVHGQHGEVKIVRSTCGSGLQYRNVTCLRANDMVPVNNSLCKEVMPATIQRCKVPCKRDCQVSHWSRWGPCRIDKKSKKNMKREDPLGERIRERSIIASPLNGGQSCPHLHELDICDEETIVDWQYGEWKDCILDDPQATCGDGRRTRDKTCVTFSGKYLDDYICDTQVIEWDNDYCRIPCPNDCVLSDWSQWSVCSMTCYAGIAGQRTRNKTLLADAGEGGVCKERKYEDEFCNWHYCAPIKWHTEEWGICLPSEDRKPDDECDLGVQKRKVYCTKGENVTRSDGRCKLLPKPEIERKCNYPCPVDCIVTNFTDWTTCDQNCETDAIQYRYRLIIQLPKHGGNKCPEALLEARHCAAYLQPTCLRQRIGMTMPPSYQWNTNEWSECMISVEKQHCGIGFQIRNISCLDSSNREVEPYFCLPSTADRFFNYIPSAMRSCEVTCSTRCVMTTWSAWSECKYTYKYKRSRHREIVDPNSALSDCQPKFKLIDEEECPKIPESLEKSNFHWLSCIVDEANVSEILVNGQMINHTCGRGYRYKSGLQISEGTGVGPGLERDLCLVDCPVDCQMSEWTEWSSCSVPCGRGFRERRRNILVPANDLGRPCPETINKTEIQKDVCHIVCADFNWMADSWSHCNLHKNDSICGNGTHFRSVRCHNKWTDEEVSESKCDPLQKPLNAEHCRLHCPGECVVSSWTVAQKCSEPCLSENFLVMKRTILRYPNSSSEPCPPLTSRSPCILNGTCYEHSFIMGSWGSCVLPDGAACGEGVQKRPLICRRSDGRQVDSVQCEKNHRSPSLLEPISKPCYIDCPADCILSEWSEWNEIACNACGTEGVMTRKRFEIQSPSDGGQPCSSELEQRKPCNFKACYNWNHTSWSSCDLESGDCGYGVQRRSVQCLRYDGLHVDKIKCLIVNLTFTIQSSLDPSWLALAQDDNQEERICHVPCPGDCIMTEWTRWSHCQKNCRIGQKVGYQTSSRRILFAPDHSSESSCPTTLFKTKPCWTDDCNFFQWKMIDESLVCEGKDGTVVQGGCTSLPLPCEHWCQNLGGRCDSISGVCRCESPGEYGTVLEDHSSAPCKSLDNGPHPPANHSAPTQVKYYPDDSQVSFWMYAMISIGTAFVIFVAVTVYMMCRSSLRQRTASVERQPSVRRRTNLPQETNNCSNATNITINRSYE